jgi:hypothetical protein
MKVGDLVALKMKKTQPLQVPRNGVVVNVWRNHKNQIVNVDIMWEGCITSHIPALFEVVNEDR